MDINTVQTGARTMWNATPPNYTFNGYTGFATYIGIVGTGIDYLSPDFYTMNGTTKVSRIQYIWDQTYTGGPTPYDYGLSHPNAPSLLKYGGMWGPNEISAALNGGALLPHQDTDGSGTGCASIAGGTGSVNGGTGFESYKYTGLAPRSKFFIVKLADAPTFLGGNQIGRVIDAVKWIRAMAAVNGTWNTTVMVPTIDFGGPNDGTGLLEDSLNDMTQITTSATENQKVFWIVSSAGYMGNQARAGEISTTTQDATADITVTIPNYTPATITTTTGEDGVLMELNWSDSENYEITVLNPSSAAIVSDIGEGGSHTVLNHASGTVSVSNYGHNSYTGGGTMKAYVYLARKSTSDNKIAAGDWKVRLKQKHATGPSKTVQLRITKYSDSVRGAGGEKPVVKSGGGLVNARLITSPGSAEGVLTAGAYATRASWTDYQGTPRSTGVSAGAIMTNSSIGYLRESSGTNSIIRPDLCAPGTAIATRSQWDTNAATNGPYWLQNTTKYRMYTGPLVAAAHLAGCISLWQDWYDNVISDYTTVGTLRQMFRDRAVADTATGAVPNTTWGFGKLNCTFSVQAPGGTGGIIPSDGGGGGSGGGELPDDIPPIQLPNP